MAANVYISDNQPESRAAMVAQIAVDIQARHDAGAGSIENILAYSIIFNVTSLANQQVSLDRAVSVVEDFLLAHKAIVNGSLPHARRVGFVQFSQSLKHSCS
jgi:hypothetical protein